MNNNNELIEAVKDIYESGRKNLDADVQPIIDKITHKIILATNDGQTFIKFYINRKYGEAVRDGLRQIGYKVIYNREQYDNPFILWKGSLHVWGWSEIKPGNRECNEDYSD